MIVECTSEALMFGNLLKGKSDSKAGSSARSTASATPHPTGSPSLQGRKGVNLKKRFQILSEMQRGSMSEAFRAIDNEQGGVVFLKVQNRQLTEEVLARASQVGRPTEGEIGMIIRHPNVCRTFEYGTTNKKDYYLTTEFIEGVSLRHVAESAGYSLTEKLERLAQAADGLAAVHQAGFLHHDVAPKNFLISSKRRVKIIDFGLAVPDTPAFHKPGNRTGTLNYMAPELLRRKPVDHRIDVFGFGVVVFELLTGRLPYDGADSMAQMTQRINQPPLDPQEVQPDMPENLCQFLRQLIAPDPKDRWSSMSTVGDRLRELAGITTGQKSSEVDDFSA